MRALEGFLRISERDISAEGKTVNHTTRINGRGNPRYSVCFNNEYIESLRIVVTIISFFDNLKCSTYLSSLYLSEGSDL